MHIVTWDSANYASIMEAMKEPQGLAVLGVLFEVSHLVYNHASCIVMDYPIRRSSFSKFLVVFNLKQHLLIFIWD